MATVSELFGSAVAQLNAGHAAEAEQICRHVLAAHPKHGDSLHLLGAIAFTRGVFADAAAFFQQAISCNGKVALYHVNLAKALRKLGDVSRAELALRKALTLQPRNFEALCEQGGIHFDKQHYVDAVESFKRALIINPNAVEAHAGLAAAFIALENFHDSIASCRRALLVNPGRPEIYQNLAFSYRKLGNFDEALRAYKESLRLNPNDAETYNNVGSLLHDYYRFEDAITFFRQALRLKPDFARAHNNLGLALHMLGRTREAKASMECALALQPTMAGAHVGMAMIAELEGDVPGALLRYQHALDASADHPGAHYNRALTRLRQGAWAEGWEDLEWRWKTPFFTARPRPFAQPLWQGQSLGDGKLLIWGEQGVGDEILYISMLQDLVARGTNLIVECDTRLAPVVARAWPSISVVGRTDPPALETKDSAIAAQIPMGSLGRWLRRGFEDFATAKAYLKPDEQKRDSFFQRLLKEKSNASSRPLLVGISWISKNPAVGGNKSSSLMDWAPILKQKNVRFVDLQYGDTNAERENVLRQLGVEVCHIEELDTFNDLDGLAALISACDLVITVSNTTAHLAGALGVPTWVLVPTGLGQIWYWLADRQDSPWYAAVRLFRLPGPGKWSPVMKDIAKLLGSWPRPQHASAPPWSH